MVGKMKLWFRFPPDRHTKLNESSPFPTMIALSLSLWASSSLAPFLSQWPAPGHTEPALLTVHTYYYYYLLNHTDRLNGAAKIMREFRIEKSWNIMDLLLPEQPVLHWCIVDRSTTGEGHNRKDCGNGGPFQTPFSNANRFVCAGN